MNPLIKVYNLPIEYCYIKKENDILYTNHAIIVQHQASRQVRDKKELL